MQKLRSRQSSRLIRFAARVISAPRGKARSRLGPIFQTSGDGFFFFHIGRKRKCVQGYGENWICCGGWFAGRQNGSGGREKCVTKCFPLFL